MNRKEIRPKDTALLTPAEVGRLNHMEPGDSITLRRQTLTCHASKPCRSGENCTLCALYNTHCEGVACMRGIPRYQQDGNDVLREQDVFFTINF